jgi:18S rRNA (guanine1575-N7)-methyltransferase
LDEKFSFNVKRKRPEETYSSVIDYFKGERLMDYALSKNIMKIQWKITKRALELIGLESMNLLILDAGCGPGFASFYLRSQGYKVVALDLIKEFLDYYEMDQINPLIADMTFIPFRAEKFDAIISISTLQWIFRDPSDVRQIENVIRLFESFYSILRKKGRAIIQYYPKNEVNINNLRDIIKEFTPFKGHFVIDNPRNPKKRRVFLLLFKDF